jgi:hypothetical protein
MPEPKAQYSNPRSLFGRLAALQSSVVVVLRLVHSTRRLLLHQSFGWASFTVVIGIFQPLIHERVILLLY